MFDWKIERMKKGIKLKEIADYLNCSISLLSRFENEKIKIAADKVADYKYYIKNKNYN